jgi:hypothetical protein
MAVTPAGAALTAQHYRLQLAVRAATLRDITRLWPMFDPTNFDTFSAFSKLAAVLVINGRSTSAGIAARYLDAFALAEGRPRPRVVIPDLLERDVAADSLRATGLVGTLNARRSGFSIEAAKRAGLVRLAGSATSLVLGGGRTTITDTVKATPAVTRWQRVTSDDPCAFCAMLASRGAAYGDDADFEAHDHCSCTAEPAYDGSRMTDVAERFRAEWDRSTEGKSGDDALNAFRSALAGDADSEE